MCSRMVDNMGSIVIRRVSHGPSLSQGRKHVGRISRIRLIDDGGAAKARHLSQQVRVLKLYIHVRGGDSSADGYSVLSTEE